MITPIPKLSNYPHGNGRHVLGDLCDVGIVTGRILSLRPDCISADTGSSVQSERRGRAFDAV